jgi:hypothetical protein
MRNGWGVARHWWIAALARGAPGRWVFVEQVGQTFPFLCCEIARSPLDRRFGLGVDHAATASAKFEGGSRYSGIVGHSRQRSGTA